MSQAEASLQLLKIYLFLYLPTLGAAGALWHIWTECCNLFAVKLSQGGKRQGGHERSELVLCLES